MFAIIEVGNRQFRVETDSIIAVEKTGHESGEEFEIKKVLMKGEGSNIEIGKPFLSSTVKVRVMEDFRAKKIWGFKYKKRKNYRRTWGHRQNLQKLQVLSLG